ncbi:MAG: hypothetical protein AB1401_04915 [Thermodesulfobacteriota bacterium]
MSGIEPYFNELIHRVRDSIVLRRVTLIFFLVLVNVLKFGVKAPLSNAVFFLLVVWFLTTFIFAYVIKILQSLIIGENLQFKSLLEILQREKG